jgi:hypothetical protein
VTRFAAYKNLMRRDAETMAARVTELLKAEQDRLVRLGKANDPRAVARCLEVGDLLLHDIAVYSRDADQELGHQALADSFGALQIAERFWVVVISRQQPLCDDPDCPGHGPATALLFVPR